MTINLKIPDIRELRPRITVFGVGGAGGNAVNNMISAGLQGVDFVVANTDAQALTISKAERIIQMGVQVTEGLGAGSQPDVGRAAARGSDRRNPRSPLRRAHGVRHRRHGRRHRHRRGAGDRQGGAGSRHSHRRRHHQAVPFRRPAPHAHCRRRHHGTAKVRRHAAHHSRTRICSAWRTRRRLSPMPSPWRTRCCIPASPASPI